MCVPLEMVRIKITNLMDCIYCLTKALHGSICFDLVFFFCKLARTTIRIAEKLKNLII